jgi:hypothetical protein
MPIETDKLSKQKNRYAMLHLNLCPDDQVATPLDNVSVTDQLIEH